MSTRTSVGLDGTIVAQSQLGSIDGIAGRLSYCGYAIHDLVMADWEEVVYLLWHNDLPRRAQLATFRERLAAARALSPIEMQSIRRLPTTGHGMDALRSMVSVLGQCTSALSETLRADNVLDNGFLLTARMPTLVAAWVRLRAGLEPVAPDPTLNHAANMLYMLHGRQPSDLEVQAFNTYLILLAEHGLNVSTFTARVVSSAQNDLCSAITAAVAALKGIAHGGANEFAMRTFLEIGDPDRAADAVDELLARKERLMGVGHRIYKVEDPRVRHLRQYSAALASDPTVQQNVSNGAQSHAVAEQVAEVVLQHPHFQQRRLFPNVEFYSAPLLYQLGVPLDCFTAAFACARVPGWVAHIREQLADNRIMRPEAEYIGAPERVFVPLDERQ